MWVRAQGLLVWAPVGMGLGIGLWLGWAGDPSRHTYGGAVALALLGGVVWVMARLPSAVRIAGLGGLLVACGFLAIGARAFWVAAPVLQSRFYGPVEGRVIHIDRAAEDRLRLTLDRLRLGEIAPDRLPHTVRVTLHAPQPHIDLAVGMRVMLTAHLSPPQGPAEPDGFDFQRYAWFQSLGAVGYSRTPVLALQGPQGWDLALGRLRRHLSAAVQVAVPGEGGAFAAAMMTGDRSGMGAEAVRHLRDSGLYHLVSISGVHMSLLAAFVFGLVRGGLALIAPLVLRVAVKKVAAVVALAVSGFYLLLSGGDVATLRAFVMVAVMLGAILADRRAISLRSIALAAVVVLIWTPEALVSPGFQMSFAATTGLVVAMGALQRLPMALWLQRGLAVFVSASVAGLASAPFAAAHFNRFTDYGLIANILVSPIMALVVMPAGGLAAVLGPLGIGAPAFWALGWGTEAILGIARLVADSAGAIRMIPSPPPWVLPMLGLLGPALVLLRGWAGAGVVLALMAVAGGWVWAPRPQLLIAEGGVQVGVWTPAGRVLSAPNSAGYVSRSWAEGDGDLEPSAEQREALPLPAGGHLVHLRGKRGLRALPQACAQADLVVLSIMPTDPVPEGCPLVTPADLARTGAIAVWPSGHIRLSRGAHVRIWQKGPSPFAQPPDWMGVLAGTRKPKAAHTEGAALSQQRAAVSDQ